MEIVNLINEQINNINNNNMKHNETKDKEEIHNIKIRNDNDNNNNNITKNNKYKNHQIKNVKELKNVIREYNKDIKKKPLKLFNSLKIDNKEEQSFISNKQSSIIKE